MYENVKSHQLDRLLWLYWSDLHDHPYAVHECPHDFPECPHAVYDSSITFYSKTLSYWLPDHCRSFPDRADFQDVSTMLPRLHEPTMPFSTIFQIVKIDWDSVTWALDTTSRRMPRITTGCVQKKIPKKQTNFFFLSKQLSYKTSNGKQMAKVTMLNYNSMNTLRPRQNGRHFPDDIFTWIFLNENVSISIKTSLKFVPKGPIDNIPALVQIMAWRRSGDKPLSERLMVRLLTHMWGTRGRWVNKAIILSNR